MGNVSERMFSDGDGKGAEPGFLPAGAGRVRVGETMTEREWRLYSEKLERMTPEELAAEESRILGPVRI